MWVRMSDCIASFVYAALNKIRTGHSGRRCSSSQVTRPLQLEFDLDTLVYLSRYGIMPL